MTTEQVVAAACCAGPAAVGGLLVPWLVTRLPEPEDADDDKLPYAVLAAGRRLGIRCAVAAGVVAGSIGAVLGPDWSLPVWVYLAVVGVGLGYVDWRTKLLPYRLVAPSYPIVALLLVGAAAATADGDALLRAVIAGAATFAIFYALWFVYPPGMGYGDVRLSGVLALALGWLGWSQLVVGVYAGFLLGALVGGALAVAKVVDRRSYPFGPFMLAGTWLGVVTGPLTAPWLG